MSNQVIGIVESDGSPAGWRFIDPGTTIAVIQENVQRLGAFDTGIGCTLSNESGMFRETEPRRSIDIAKGCGATDGKLSCFGAAIASTCYSIKRLAGFMGKG